MDYKKIGFKAGLEIHQQLDSKKLFCRCPSLLRKDKPDFKIKRRLFAVAGETGKIDVAALHEQEKGKEFIYEGYEDTNCLVEIDESPPYEINKEALKIALQISLILNAKIFPIIQVMRKTVIDGSNPSGFQRTMLIAKDGFVEIDNKKIKIETICLEEDAARKIKTQGKKVIFRVDRQGIPLIEIATAPELESPEEAKKAALKIGYLLRICKVKRGLGTIRQDVNMSLRGGKRIEIKGVQKPELIVKCLNYEIKRQLELIKKKKSREEVRQALANSKTRFLRPLPGKARMYPETDLPLIKIDKNFILKLKRNLPKIEEKQKIEERLKEELNEDLKNLLLKYDYVEEYEKLKHYGKFIAARILCFILPELNIKINEKFKDKLIKILEALKKKKIAESSLKKILSESKDRDIDEVLRKYELLSEDEIEKILREIINFKPNLNEKALMGIAMKKLRGKAEGKIVMKILKKLRK